MGTGPLTKMSIDNSWFIKSNAGIAYCLEKDDGAPFMHLQVNDAINELRLEREIISNLWMEMDDDTIEFKFRLHDNTYATVTKNMKTDTVTFAYRDRPIPVNDFNPSRILNCLSFKTQPSTPIL